MSKIWERIYNGIIKENPTFIQTLGMCPTLAVTTSMINGIGMGLSTLMVLVASNILISLLKKFIPNTVRIPAYIVVIASLVTIVQFVLQGFVPALYSSLGIYIPLIVVNCIILGRAEAYAGKNAVIPSIADGIGMGLGFTMALAIIGFIRELIGNGTILSDGANALVTIPGYTPASIVILAPGAFFVLAFVIAAMNKMKMKKGMKPAEVPDYTSEDGCEGCAGAAICRPDKAAANTKPAPGARASAAVSAAKAGEAEVPLKAAAGAEDIQNTQKPQTPPEPESKKAEGVGALSTDKDAPEFKAVQKEEVAQKAEIKEEVKEEIKELAKEEVKGDIQEDVKDIKETVKEDIKEAAKEIIEDTGKEEE